MESSQRVSREAPCRICGGWDRMPRGQGKRCFGYLGGDGKYAHCSRDEFAGGLEQHANSLTYAHKLGGPCRCGVTHEPEPQVLPIGTAKRAETVAMYDYVDEHGTLVYQVVRKHPKAFLQRRPNGNGSWLWNLDGVEPLLYRLPDVIRAVAAGDEIWIAEGEKDVQAIERSGLVSTCNSGGAGKFPSAMAKHLTGADVVIVRDADDTGREHARDLFLKLKDVAKSIRVVESREGKDASDHLGAGLTPADFVLVWPIDRRTDPAQWQRNVLRSALHKSEPISDPTGDSEIAPGWPVGLYGFSTLKELRGVTILTGGPSAGKTVLAVASSVESALAGWNVVYLVCEMPEGEFRERVHTYCQGDPPPSWQFKMISMGVTLEALVDVLCEAANGKPMLVVFDSVSSFTDQAENTSDRDLHGYALARRTLFWAVNARRQSQGQIGFLLLSERNAKNETKFRIADYKADLAVTLDSDKQSPMEKHVRVIKGWRTPTGYVGSFAFNEQRCRLERTC